MDLIKQLQTKAPSSWSKFEKWYFKFCQKRMDGIVEMDRAMLLRNFHQMFFEEQLGVFLKYLEENKIGWLIEYTTLPEPDWKMAILNSFVELQK